MSEVDAQRVTEAVVREFVTAYVARFTGIPAAAVHTAVPIAALGVDSVHAIDLVIECANSLAGVVPGERAWQRLSIEEIARHLAGNGPTDAGEHR